MLSRARKSESGWAKRRCAASATASYTLTAAGNIGTATDSAGRVTTYTYDTSNRITQIHVDEGAPLSVAAGSGETSLDVEQSGGIGLDLEGASQVSVTGMYFDNNGKNQPLASGSDAAIPDSVSDLLPRGALKPAQ